MFKIIYSLKSLQLCNILRSGNPLIPTDLFPISQLEFIFLGKTFCSMDG